MVAVATCGDACCRARGVVADVAVRCVRATVFPVRSFLLTV